MKAILEFNLPEDSTEHTHAINGGLYHSILWGLDQYCRNKIKYSELSEEVHDSYQNIRDQISSSMSNQGLTFGD